MKLGFYVFGLSMGGMGVWSLYEMAQPELDSEGKEIEDEYSHLPTFDRYKSRILKNFNYYQRVSYFCLTSSTKLLKSNSSLCKNHQQTNCCLIL